MKEEKAQIIFIALNVTAVVLVGMAGYDFITALNSVSNRIKQIPFDAGLYYFLLASVFWLMSLIQYHGKRNKKSFYYQKASQLLVGWFIFTLVLANVLPAYLKNRFTEAGYTQCIDPAALQRVTRAESRVYTLGECVEIGN